MMMVRMSSLSFACSIVTCLSAVGLFFDISVFEHMLSTSSSTIFHQNKTYTTKTEVPGLVPPTDVSIEQHLDSPPEQSPKNDTNKNVDGNINNHLPKPFHFCTKKVVYFDKSQRFPVQYQCIGEHYDEFARVLHSLADTLPEPMGRRDFPMASDRNVLVVGNSHTRQMISSLICQYKEKVVEFGAKVVASNATDSTNVRFANNSTIVSITNSAILDSPDWVALIEKRFRRPLNSYDGIVLGKLNSNQGSKPPKLRDVAKVYSGPVVYVSMFARYGNSELTESIHFINTVKNIRHNLSTISGRKYIDKMKMECGAMNVNSAGPCYEDSDKNVSRAANSMHRCVGAKGGHPDLIAWEVAEKLNAL